MNCDLCGIDIMNVDGELNGFYGNYVCLPCKQWLNKLDFDRYIKNIVSLFQT